MLTQDKIRNIAIIAHVDHGKTTLVDAFLKQSHLFRENQEEMQQEQILDSGELEREKGITIKAKNIAIEYNGYKINIIDTPGHADFGGEVERTLNMADGCLLVVDAQEGPMPQTEFVLRKAMELKLRPIVVINKIDKKFANPKKVVSRLQDLFLKLATEDAQLEFPVFYAIAREGLVFDYLPEVDVINSGTLKGDLKPLLEEIVNYVPAPTGDPTGPLQMQINALIMDPHLGRYLIGRIRRGSAKVNDSIQVLSVVDDEKHMQQGKIKKIFVRKGLDFIEVEEAGTGDIAAIIGVESTAIGGTICIATNPDPLPMIKISPPAVKIKFEPNTSPLLGKEGKFVAAKQIQQRLEMEKEHNIGLNITKADGASYYVAGRGELHLSILIETMRREGYEFQVRKPEIIIQQIDGKDCEPMEELIIDTNESYVGTITEALNQRSAELVNMETETGQVRMTYKILTRNLFGLRSYLLTATKGNAVLNSYILDYVPVTKQPEIYRKGVLISSENGTAIGYALNTIQERGDLFVEPATQVYEGMIIGVNKYEQDMDVNPIKGRAKSGVRVKHDEITQTALKPVIPLTLEYALVFLRKDEILEVTPKSLRLRKQYLSKTERVWAKRDSLSPFAKQNLGK
jgi:GTP-binding protein